MLKACFIFVIFYVMSSDKRSYSPKKSKMQSTSSAYGSRKFESPESVKDSENAESTTEGLRTRCCQNILAWKMKRIAKALILNDLIAPVEAVIPQVVISHRQKELVNTRMILERNNIINVHLHYVNQLMNVTNVNQRK